MALPPATPGPPSEPSQRLLSLDAFRGLVITCMLFVNQLEEMPSVPSWLKHAPAHSDQFTFPDLVFPGFLLIVGLSIPFSLARRGDSIARKLLRVVVRSASLIALGVVLEFNDALDEANTGMSHVLWMSLFYLGMFMVWQVVPSGSSLRHRRLMLALRGGGLVLLLALLAVFRAATDDQGHAPWFQTQWWGILGMIGWGYLTASLVYLCTRGRTIGLCAALALMVALYMGSRHGALSWLPRALLARLDVGELMGSVSAAVMLGVLIGAQFAARPATTPGQRLRFVLALAGCTLAAGCLLRPIHGISKIGTTESYVLVVGAILSAVFALCYLAVDVQGVRLLQAPARVLAQVGQNPFLAYVLPGVWSYLLAICGVDWWQLGYPFHDASMLLALGNAALVTAFFSAVLLGCTRVGLRLQL